MTADEIHEFATKNLEVLKAVYSRERSSLMEAGRDLTAILQAEYATLTEEEIEQRMERNSIDDDNSYMLHIHVKDNIYILSVDMRKWPSLFKRYRCGFGAENALKTYVWKRCAKRLD